MAYTVTNNPWSSQYAVGIGTDSITNSAMLEVIGEASSNDVIKVKHAAGGSAWLKLGFWNGTTERASIRTQDDNSYLSFFEGTSEKMRIKDGNVGIGTTGPNKLLTVSAAFGTAKRDLLDLQSTTAGGGTQPMIRFGTWAGNSNTMARIGVVDIPNYGGGFVVETNSTGGATDATTEKFRIGKDGNVSIGTTGTSVGGQPGATTGLLNLYASGTMNGAWMQQIRADNNSGNGLFIRAGYNSSYYTAYFTGYDESNVHFVVRGDGNVGIGIASPRAKLDVRGYIVSDVNGAQNVSGFYLGNSAHGIKRGNDNNVQFYTTSGNLYLGANGADSNQVTLLNNGNVGIGTASPSIFTAFLGTSSAFLTINAASGATLELAGNRNNVDGLGHIGFINNENSAAGTLNANSKLVASIASVAYTTDSNAGDDSGGDLRFYTKPEAGTQAERIRVDPDGNVGIGTTVPVSPLHIDGSVGSLGQLTLGRSGINGVIDVPESLYINIDTDNDSTDRIFSINKNGKGEGAGTTLLMVGETGNVGIGTTAPGEKLAVNGSIILGNAGGGGYLKYNTGNLYLEGQSGIVTTFESGGNVGIGTTNPATNLEIVGGVGSPGDGIRISRTGFTSTHYLTIDADSINANAGDVGIQSDESGNVILVTGGGNVGIGTASPDADLHIYEASVATPIQITRANNSSNGMIKFETGTTDDWIIGERNDSTSNFRIYSYGTSSDVFSILRASGNVGIGTTSPGAKLEVNTSTNYDGIILRNGTTGMAKIAKENGTNDGYFYLYQSGTAKIFFSAKASTNSYLNNGGNFGIGTASPAASLQIESGSATQVKIVNTGTASGRFMVGNDAHLWISTDGANRDINFATNTGTGLSNERMTVTDDGVGIGTTSPGYKLEVNGTFYSAGSSVAYKENIEDLEVDSSLIHSLRPVSYDYKKKYKDFGYNVKDGKQMGLISEEVAETIPELAIMKDGKPKNVDYQKLTVVLLAEVQNLKKEIEEIKSK